jgi:hypothetical protein
VGLLRHGAYRLYPARKGQARVLKVASAVDCAGLVHCRTGKGLLLAQGVQQVAVYSRTGCCAFSLAQASRGSGMPLRVGTSASSATSISLIDGLRSELQGKDEELVLLHDVYA